MLPENIDLEKKYQLSAYLYVDRFFYGILDDNKVSHSESIHYLDQYDLRRKIKSSGLDKLKLEKVVIVSNMSPAGLIDYDKFEYHNFKDYFSDHYPEELLSVVNYYSNKLAGQKIFNTFAISSGIANMINKLFPDAQFFHVTKVLSDYLVKKKSDSILMLLSETQLSIVSVEDGLTSFSNQFDLNGPLDPVYYVQSLYEELNYEETKPCYIIDSNADKEVIDTFQKHFNNCSVIPSHNTELIEAMECAS